MQRKLSASNPGPLPHLRKLLIKTATIGIALEALTLLGGYGFYHQMQKNPEFAQHVNENYPLVIEYGRKVGNFYDSINPFKEVMEKWQADKKN